MCERDQEQIDVAQNMTRSEYKVVYGKPMGTILMPWASQKVRDEIGIGSFERKPNKYRVFVDGQMTEEHRGY